jgi:thymidine kinase
MGHLSLLIGCMFAQKTTELMRRVRRFQSINSSVLVVNYIGDKRYGTDCVASHDKDTISAKCVEKLEEIDVFVRTGSYSVIAIDEGQFFTDLFEYVTSWADNYKVHIIVAGLDGTSDRTPFGDILRLIPHAEEVERLNALCALCADGTIATYTKYAKNDKTGDVHIGGKESYYPVCRKHRNGF